VLESAGGRRLTQTDRAQPDGVTAPGKRRSWWPGPAGIFSRPWVELLLVLAVLGVATFFRAYRLAEIPPGLDLDEARDGLEAARILAGQHPIMFTTFDPREPAFFYTLAASIALLGHTGLALHAAPAVWGVAAVGLTYAVARQWFGRWVAALSALGMATSFWQVVESRWSIHSITFPVVILLFLSVFWEALSRKSTWLFVLSGVCLAVGPYAFVAARLLPFTIVAVLALQWLLDRDSVRGIWRGLLAGAAVCGALVVPLALKFITDPSSFTARAAQVSVFGPPLPGIAPLTPVQTILRTLGMFFISGDASWQKNIPYRPVFDWWLAAPFCIGVLWASWHWGRTGQSIRSAFWPDADRRSPWPTAEGMRSAARLRPCLWLLAALITTLIPGFFSRPAPHFSRTVGAGPFAYMLLALGLTVIVSWLSTRGHAFKLLASAGALALIGLLAATTFDEYFGYWAHTDGTLHDFEFGQVVDARFLSTARVPPRNTVLFLGYDSGTAIRFLAPRYDSAVWMEDFTQLVPLPPVLPATYVFASPSLPQAAAAPSILQLYFPGARVIDQAAFQNGDQAARIYRVDAAQVRAFQGTARPVNVDFRHEVRLEQASLPGGDIPARPGMQIRLGLTWKMLKDSHLNYAAFIHIINSSGKLVAQDDRQGMASFGWRAGQQFLSLHLIALPKRLPPGRYRVLAGMDQRSQGSQPSRSLGQLARPITLCTLVVNT